ncbi:NuoI/complex I 23 kDa subunit family protein [Desulfosporosinus meridiei]|uniref:NADH-quinone oxidoreductase subunit I n=1 Tax=Desulfosporosinus meridiei (strain ATCC BAA-275 / DSM 13257 / KCTC 12902 / NCIMB 13706 / S10) TaxID=768704 RepID=J7IUZ5_DESMD|nr:NADH-quinone oxidoreductase subunit I [Desulfosporosinus meridiei]AFQ45555.1 NADH dehydrogenase subunit I [Desulfosporosinus meridiei DSM 13257]
MFGKGLLQGLGITFKRMVGPNITEFYPEEKPNLPIRVRSSMGLEKDKCISCNMCAMACPNSVIKLTSEKNEANKKVLKTYHMDVGRCLFCGMCAEVCPTKALKVTQEFENAIYEPEEMQWDMIKRAERKGKVE